MTAHLLSHGNQNGSGVQHWVKIDESVLSPEIQSQASAFSQPPPGFPSTVEGPMTWSGKETTNYDLPIVELTKEDVAEIEKTLEEFKELELDGDDVNRERFPLPNLESRLDRCALEIHHGMGLCIIRGLDPERYSVEDNMIIFLGISCYIGSQRGIQNAKGEMICLDCPQRKAPWYSYELWIEILSMHVRNCAASGGSTCVASSRAIYNDLIRSCPWAVHALAEANWPIQSSKKKPPYTLSPLIEFHMGNLIMSVDPARVGPRAGSSSSVRDMMMPRLSSDQDAALAELQATARRHQLQLDNRPGDMVYLNNWAMLHAREPYHDAATSARHIVRLWLRNDELGWPVPASMHEPWDASFGDEAARFFNRQYPLAPMPAYMESKFTNGTAAFVRDFEDDLDEKDESTSAPRPASMHSTVESNVTNSMAAFAFDSERDDDEPAPASEAPANDEVPVHRDL